MIRPETTLRLSPNFAVLPGYGGQSLLVEQVHPYRAHRLSEQLLVLTCEFISATRVADAVSSFLRRVGSDDDQENRCAALESIVELFADGILLSPESEYSIYKKEMAPQYASYRPVPREVARVVAEQARLHRGSRVLDLATGTGSLAISLAERSEHVRGMDLSVTFLDAARDLAAERGVPVELVHDSCNRLRYHEHRYDVVTLSQAFHWMDRFAVSQGIHRVLVPGGLFFLISAFTDVPQGHPIRPLLAPHLPDARAIAQWLDAEAAQAAKLFDAGTAADPLLPIGVWRFLQRRPFNLGYAEAHFTDWHIDQAADRERWAYVKRELAAKPDDELMGDDYWSVTCFQKPPLTAASAHEFTSIAWAPAAGPPLARRRAQR